MELTDERLQQMVQVVADTSAREYNLRHNAKISVPIPISFDLELKEPKCAGRAFTQTVIDERGRLKISRQWLQLNMTLLRDNVREFLNRVVIHEVAHLDQAWKDLKSGSQSADHGYVWQASMRAMNQPPVAKHQMDTTKAVAVYKEHKAKQRAEAKKVKKVTA